MKFAFISESTFEPWDWTNPDTKGIGGSETSHIEMAQRLARLGHEVISFSPTGSLDCQIDPAGVIWHDFGTLQALVEVNGTFGPPSMRGVDVFVIYRAPNLIDFVPDGAPCWLICQDTDYTRPGQSLTPERIAKLTRLVALCQTQADFYHARYPAARVSVSSNGIKRQVIEEIALDPPERNPHRIMYASSPDRGMDNLLEIFPRIKEMVSDAELHIYYGFDNIEKVIAHWGKNSIVATKTDRLRALLEQPGVTFHGRLGQKDLLREWFKAGLWVHPSNFTETSCITCMDAQACGAIPITSPVWAISENVKHGIFIEGNVNNELVRARYIRQTFGAMVQPGLQDEIRADMMDWALDTFDWDIFARQWEGWARQDTAVQQMAGDESGSKCRKETEPAITPEELENYPGVWFPPNPSLSCECRMHRETSELCGAPAYGYNTDGRPFCKPHYDALYAERKGQIINQVSLTNSIVAKPLETVLL